MNPKIKYWLEDNKDKLYIGGAGVALVGLLAGAFVLMTRDTTYKQTDTVGITLADYVLAQKADGAIQSFALGDNKNSDTFALSDTAIPFKSENLDGLYLYDQGTVSKLVVSDKGDLSTETLFAITDIGDVTHASTSGDRFVFKTADKLVVSDTTGALEMVFENNQSDTYHLADTGIYLALDDAIQFVDFEKGETQYINMGDKTTGFSQHTDTIIARNDFGKGKNTETYLEMTDGSLHINNLKRLPAANKLDIPGPRNENQLVFIETRSNEKEGLARQDLAVLGLDATIDDDEPVNLSDFTLPLDTVEPFSAEKTMSVRGFLYDWTDTGLRVIEMRNGREVTRVQTEQTDAPLFVPIYLD